MIPCIKSKALFHQIFTSHRIGQKVLSLTKEGGLYYWPGTVNEVSLRERIGTTIRYEVEFWNGDSTKVPRRCLYTAEDPQFYTCQVRWMIPEIISSRQCSACNNLNSFFAI